MPFVIFVHFGRTIDIQQTHLPCSLCDSECTWGLKCLTYNRHMPARPATYEERLGYVYDSNACGQGVVMYILGMSVSDLFVRLVMTQVLLTAGPAR